MVAYGLELENIDSFEYVTELLKEVAPAVGVNLIPIKTNIYLEYRAEDRKDKFDFWIYKFQGAVLAALGHAFANRLAVLSIAATFDLPYLGLWGSILYWILNTAAPI